MDISNLSLEEKVGQMLMFAFHGLDYNNQIDTFIHEFKIGGVAYFARNIKELDRVTTLNHKIQKESKIPLFIGLDQEGGSVLRIFDKITPLPGAMALSASNRNKIYEITKAVGEDLKSLGFNMNFAPVGDVNNNKDNPVINSRSYSDDPIVVGNLAKSAYLGFQDSYILPTIKHFPGHGNTSVDSHVGLPIVKLAKEEVFKTELIPFIEAINNGIDGVMISHIVYSCFDEKLPSSLSYNIVTKLLKEQLGYRGLICTDSLTMSAIFSNYTIEEILFNSVNAGVDLLMFCGKADIPEQTEIVRTFIKLVKEGKIPLSRVDESVEKILNLKIKYCNTNNEFDKVNKINLNEVKRNNQINYPLSMELQNQSITKVIDINNVLPIKRSDKVLTIFPEIKVVSFIDNENIEYETLGKVLNTEEIIINQELNNIQDIQSCIAKFDKVIMATYNVKKDDYQHKVFETLNKDKTIVVSMRSPYDITNLNGVKTYICIYEATKQSFLSLEKALYGEIPFLGKLPIKL